MNKERMHSDDALREKFNSFEGDIPMSDWDLISSRLDKKRRFAWIWWAAIPFVLVSGLSFILFFGSNHLSQDAHKVSIDKTEKSSLLLDGKQKSSVTNSTTITETNSINISKDERKPNSKFILKNNALTPKNRINSTVENTRNTNTVSTYLTYSIGLKTKQITPFSLEQNYEVITVPFLNLNRPVMTVKDPSIKFTYELGLSLSPAIGLEAIKSNKSKSIHDGFFDAINNGSSLGSGLNNGIHAQLNVGSKWYVRAGLYRVDYSVFHNYDYSVDSVPRLNANNEITSYIPILPKFYKYDGKTSIKYLSIPVLLGNRAYFGQKWGLETKLGLTMSRLLSASGEMVNPTNLELESLDGNNSLKKWNSGLNVSMGLFYKTKNNLIFTVEPNFSTLIGSAQKKDYAVKTRKYNYGINLNVNYVLKGDKK